MRLRRTGVAALLFGGLCGALAGCPRGGGGGPVRPAAAGWGLGADALGVIPLHGLAVLGDERVVASGGMVRRIARDGAVRWTAELAESGTGAVAVDGEVIAAAVGGSGDIVKDLPGGLRGEPGAAIVGLAAGDGARRWTVGAGSSRWSVIDAVAGSGDGFLIAGSFAGTLRIGELTVTAAGNADGFVAALGRDGAVRWLRRTGGDGPDAIHGVAALGGGRIAIAGTFTGPAELGDTTLLAIGKDTLAADGFVAVLEADGRIAWARTWGGPQEDTCAGLAVLSGGAIAVAGTVRGGVDVAGRLLEGKGPADGLVAVFAPDASIKGAWLVGGDDFDGITAIGGAGAQIAVAGWFTGTLPLPGGAGERSDGVDDVFVAVGDAGGVQTVHSVRSAGPASASALAAGPDGWTVAVHGAESMSTGGDVRPAGAALWFRGW